jgi:hypothetical protein
MIVGLLTAVEGHHIIDGTWLGQRLWSSLSIDLTVGRALKAEGICGEPPLVEVTARVRTRDGVVDAQGSVLQVEPQLATLEVAIDGLPDAYLHGDPVMSPGEPSWTSRTEPTLVVAFRQGLRPCDSPAPLPERCRDGLDAALFVAGRMVGKWSSEIERIPWRQVAHYTVPTDLQAECASAAEYVGGKQYTPFASASACSAAMVGTWIRCRDSFGPQHAGIEVLPDRKWRHLLWADGGLVATEGFFEHSGPVDEPVDGTVGNPGLPGFYQTVFESPTFGMSASLWGDKLILGPDMVYVRTSRVPAPPPSMTAYAARARAGAAACASSEQGALHVRPGDELESVLAGDWTLCAGDPLEEMSGLRFDGHGNVAWLKSDGTAMPARSYRTASPASRADIAAGLQMTFADGTGWDVSLSERPLELWLQTGDGRTAIFSALPAPRVAP